LIRRLGFGKVVATCLGGARRQDSVREGILAAPGRTWVVVHDAARPFADVGMFEQGLAVAQDVGAAIAAVPVKDTVKLVERANFIEQTPRRSHLWAAQTPQIFRRDQLLASYQAIGNVDVTDDAEVLERAGLPVAVYMGSYENVKLTTPGDLAIARAIARQRGRPVAAGR
jgi:2-C-methyl-D-erythritol 4-phosphate cytidylyltransferase